MLLLIIIIIIIIIQYLVYVQYKWSIEARIYYFEIVLALTNENAISNNLIGQSILPEDMLLFIV